MQLKVFPVAMLALLAVSPACVADPVDPAQVIAQKFYEASEPKRQAKPDRPDLDYEMDMLRQARAEELERRKADAQMMLTKIAQPAPVITPQPAVALTPAPPAVSAPYMTEPAAVHAAAMAKPLQTAIAQAKEPPPPTIRSKTVNGARATVLLVLDSDDNAGAARVKPDPIICFDQQCWLSNGLEAPAKPMPRSEAVALKSTDSATSDSCSGKSGCAFRDIAFSPYAQIQVIEVGESRGVADGAYTVAADTTCRKHDDDLVCNNALVTHAFRLWVVPEATAQAIGPSGLEDAVAEGLPDDGEDSTNDKSMRSKRACRSR
jgi:hypothetical protein